MEILYFCTTWGQKKGNWNDFFNQIVSEGYHGVETDLPVDEETEEFMDGLDKYGLKFIAQHWETTDATIELHQQKYEERLRKLAVLKPLFINSHTGRDFFTDVQNCSLLDIAEKVTQDTGVRIVHETHRGRFSYAAHVTLAYLQKRPALQLTLDISHWCVVAESLLQDQSEAVEMAIKHTAHLHARVGFAEGPQVADPALPAYQEALSFHLTCWDRVIANHETITITPEFGPLPYMPPNQPDDQQWQNNLYLMNLLKTRFS